MIVRNRADEVMVAIEMQRQRIVAYCQTVHASDAGLLGVTPLDSAHGRADIDMFVSRVRLLERVVALVNRSDLPGADALRVPRRLFADRVAGAITLRNSVERLDFATMAGRYTVGVGVGSDTVSLTHGSHVIDSSAVLEACRQMYRALRQIVDPLVDTGDPHYQPAIVDLTLLRC